MKDTIYTNVTLKTAVQCYQEGCQVYRVNADSYWVADAPHWVHPIATSDRLPNDAVSCFFLFTSTVKSQSIVLSKVILLNR